MDAVVCNAGGFSKFVLSLFFWRLVYAEVCQPVAPPPNVMVNSCMSSGRKVNCSDRLVTGSSVIARCESGYRGKVANVHCEEDGKWASWPFCVEDCGKLGPFTLRPRASVVFTPALRGLFAWHVAIYKLDKSPLPICGGTIISSRMILSAARCFLDETSENDQLDFDSIENYEIVVAKSTRNYHTRDSEYTRSYKIKRIISPYGNGSHSRLSFDGNFAADIIVLVPQSPIEFRKGDVFPACIDWLGHLIQNNSEDYSITGEVYGWGLSEYNKYSEYLVYVKIPQISTNECKKMMPVHQHTMSRDKFCASSEYGANKFRTCDRGSGLLAWNQLENRYFLKGIVSARNDGQNRTSILSFTNLTHYEHWIRHVKNELSGDTRESPETLSNGIPEELEGISIRLGEGNIVIGMDSPTNSSKKRKTMCKLPFRSATLKYTIGNCGSSADNPICQRKSSDSVEADTGLHVQCLNSKGEFVQFDSFCLKSGWHPSLDSCTGRRVSTSDLSVDGHTTQVSHPIANRYEILNGDEEVFLKILIQLKELIKKKIELIVGMFLFE